jgi:hypothetical protein
MYSKRALCFLLLLTSCGQANSARDLLGLDRSAPDEFRVVSRPPLSVPKEFFLRPPSDSEAEDIGGNVNQQARSLVTGAPLGRDSMSLEQAEEEGTADTAVPVVLSGELESPGESAFLQKVGFNEADKEIRAKLSGENVVMTAEEPSILERLRGETKEDPVVDAKGEAERIRTNKDGEKPLNEGEVKSIDPKKKSVIDRLFN